MGAQGVHPHNELIELTTSSEVDARALREALFIRLEKAAPKACLGNSDRDRARNHLNALLDEGFDGEAIVAAAVAWAADPKAKRKDIGLHYWLYDRRFRQHLPDAPGSAGSEPVARLALELPAEVLAVIVREKGEAFVRNWLTGAAYGGGVITTRLGVQADTVRKDRALVVALADIGVTVQGPNGLSPTNQGMS